MKILKITAAIMTLSATTLFADSLSSLSHVFITNFGNNTVSVCDIGLNQQKIGNCRDSGAGNTFSNPLGIAITPTKKYAYIANQGNGTVSVCSINTSTAKLNSCTDSGVGSIFPSPYDITVSPSGQYAYVANNQNLYSIQVCKINGSTGKFSSCNDSGVDSTHLSSPTSIKLTPDGQYAFINNYTNTFPAGQTILSCKVSPTTGSLSNCIGSGWGFGYFPTDTVFSPSGNFAYVSSFYGENIAVCKVDSQNGVFTQCGSSGAAGFYSPTTMAVSPSAKVLYVMSYYGQNVLSCKINSQGFLSSCADSGATGLVTPADFALF